jgi:predicted DNA binding CopG/RHH family protein
MKLSKEEKELLDSVERGEWRTIPNFKKEAKQYQEYARATFRKDKRVNIRISEKDLVNIQKRAI